MKIYQLKVVFKDFQDSSSLIEIPAKFTLLDLHYAILEAVKFDNKQLASFYFFDKENKCDNEITLMDMSEDGSAPVMIDFILKDVLKVKGDKIKYIYDFVLMWEFQIELVNLMDEKKLIKPDTYPLLIEQTGKLPSQYGTVEKYPDKLTDEDDKLINQFKKENLDNLDEFDIDFNEEEEDDDDY